MRFSPFSTITMSEWLPLRRYHWKDFSFSRKKLDLLFYPGLFSNRQSEELMLLFHISSIISIPHSPELFLLGKYAKVLLLESSILQHSISWITFRNHIVVSAVKPQLCTMEFNINHWRIIFMYLPVWSSQITTKIVSTANFLRSIHTGPYYLPMAL